MPDNALKQVISEVVPRPYIRTIALSSGNTDETKVGVDIVFKDDIESDLEIFWNQQHQEFSWLVGGLFVFTNSAIRDEYIKDNKKLFSGQHPTGVRVYDLEKYLVNITQIGDEYEILYHVDFIVKEPIEDLSLLAFAAYNMPEHLTSAFDFNGFEILAMLVESLEFSIEEVFNGGKLTELAKIFRLQNGDIWRGAVHFDADMGRYYTGFIPSEDRQRLLVINVANNTIADNRAIDRVIDQVLDTTLVDNFLSLFGRTKIEEPRKPPQIFSKLMLTETEEEEARMFFTVNYYEALKNSSNWPWLYDNEASRDMILELSKLRKLMLVKKRVSPYDYDRKFYDNLEEVVLLDTTDQRNFTLLSPGGGNGLDIKEITGQVFTYDETDFKLKNRHFTAVDRTAAEDAHGIYRYRVVLDVEDGAYRFLLNERNKLLPLIAKMEDYAAAAGNPNNFNYISDRYNNPGWIEQYPDLKEESIWMKLPAAVGKVMGYLSGRPEDAGIYFSLAIAASPVTGSPTTIEKIIAVANQLVTKIENLLGGNTQSEVGNLAQTGKHQQFPTRTVRYEKFFDAALNLDDDSSVGYSYFANVDQESPGLPVVKEKVFRERVTQEIRKYFNNDNPIFFIPNIPNIANYSEALASSMFSFFTPVSLKLVNFDISTVNFANSFVYQDLLIDIFLAKQTDYDLTGVPRYNAAGRKRTKSVSRRKPVRRRGNQRKKTTTNAYGKAAKRDDIRNLAGTRSMTIRTGRERTLQRGTRPARGNAARRNQAASQDLRQPVSETFGKRSVFELEDTPVKDDLVNIHSTAIDTSAVANAFMSAMFTANKFDPTIITDFLDNLNTTGESFVFQPNFIGNPIQELLDLPPQLKAIMGSTIPTFGASLVDWYAEEDTNKEEMISNYAINLLNIAELHMYTGPDSWRKLAIDDINAARAAGKRYILCRLAKYSNEDILPATNEFGLPILGDYFLLEIDFGLGQLDVGPGINSVVDAPTLQELGFEDPKAAQVLTNADGSSAPIPNLKQDAADSLASGTIGLKVAAAQAAANAASQSEEDEEQPLIILTKVPILGLNFSGLAAALQTPEESEEEKEEKEKLPPITDETDSSFKNSVVPTYGGGTGKL